MSPPHEDVRAEVRLALPWPNKLLSPNARAHHFARARAAKAARAAAFYLVIEQTGRERVKWPRVSLSWEFCPPSRRRYDVDNLISQHKAAQDGIADAIGTDDSHFQSTYQLGDPVKGGAVLVTIKGR